MDPFYYICKLGSVLGVGLAHPCGPGSAFIRAGSGVNDAGLHRGGGANDPKTRTRQMNESFNSRPCVWINDRVHLPTESSADVSATQSERRTGKSPGTSIPLHVHPDMNGNLRSC
ncbi:unnamed protein product [Pleuronectes platessa]|uniref:Uncharacterized protein n=1 Tax=Pleuronectes platessa TaxID=8262 RepID=A0A9N7UNZ3_PLEPL|nr:unnamed protein product [Pleuronectes platessa]